MLKAFWREVQGEPNGAEHKPISSMFRVGKNQVVCSYGKLF